MIFNKLIAENYKIIKDNESYKDVYKHNFNFYHKILNDKITNKLR